MYNEKQTRVVRVFVHDGRRHLFTRTFPSVEHADTYTNGFIAGASRFGGVVSVFDPFDPDENAEEMFQRNDGKESEGCSWTSILQQAKALLNAP